MTVRSLEQQDQGSIHGPRRRLSVNRLQWARSDEATPKQDLWAALSTPVAQRRSVAHTFAEKVRELNGADGLWITDLKNDLGVAISLPDPALEPEIRDLFIDLVCERLDPSEGELFVFPSGAVPDWVRSTDALI